MGMNRTFTFQVLGTGLLLLAIQANASVGGDHVDGYANLGRGSCQDQRGKGYSYLQRKVKFPNAETCGRQECERFGNMKQYRGFEYSVAQRCTCLFDLDEIPAVPNDPNDPTYVEKEDVGNGAVAGVSGTPGAWCYQFGKNSGFVTANTGYFYRSTLLAAAVIYMLL
mmetsp:Transcript_4962/g.12460  ORF Transcript_4962/g.12460 Transcript_4962/m.12460 type:complete len:167 (+) Transcript_4962:156-656(+)